MKKFLELNLQKIGPHHIFVGLACIFVLLSNVTTFSACIVLFSSVFFYISFIAGQNIFKKLNFKSFEVNYKFHEKIGLFLLLFGIFFTIMDLLWVRGVPLFDPTSRKFLSVIYTAFSHTLPLGWAIVVSSSKLSTKKIFLYSGVFAALIALLGYRTQVVVLLLSTIFAMYYSEKIKNKLMIYSLIGLALVVFGLSFLRHFILNIGGNPILSRIDLTMSIFDLIAKNFNGNFQGVIHNAVFSSYGLIDGPKYGPRTLIANSIGVTGVTITPTIFGAVLMDFGTLGLVPYFGIFGLLMGLSNEVSGKLKGLYLGFYSIMVSYLIVGIETGILDLDVVVMYFLGVISTFYGIFRGILNVKK
ncbi:oligosaccharide repeat unit polymerase [Methanococcus maripaludis]|uniref:Oligosaccharide repeat unit polymerase n=1 Tax=Methanococcus maripaludis TaxID=39152 RepID=A0A7J9S4H9_METMI|nr:oligosaccharide repeat unit polymerase family protein [Methanococcus maripaludis]MBB6400936.1 oligosaccharide repeat unit polymerase [Methanococcus maripaludis]